MNLAKAIEIAASAHSTQKDKGGSPYILHPIRVMMSLNTEEEKIVGVLHDVVEDSEDWDFDRLREEGFAEDIVSALKSVTKQSDAENYEAFIERARRNQIGRNVKIADIKDNLDVTRIGTLKEKDLLRINKYKNALLKLASGSPVSFLQES